MQGMQSFGTGREDDRVRRHTPPELNAEMDAATARRVGRYAAAGHEAMTRRIEELEREWDMERTLEANAAGFSLTGLALSRLHDRRWLWFSAGVGGFLLLHALQGWCPPVSLFRRLGVRTRREIDREKYALKALRGDFDSLASAAPDERAQHAWRSIWS